ncbi:MAG: sulfurtransferase TusA family protein [Fimbriimonadales bacterium]
MYTANRTIDARGSQCPGPLVELIRAVKEAEVGEVIELLTQEPRTKTDAREWCEKAGHEFLGVEPAEDYERIWVKKAR